MTNATWKVFSAKLFTAVICSSFHAQYLVVSQVEQQSKQMVAKPLISSTTALAIVALSVDCLQQFFDERVGKFGNVSEIFMLKF